MYYAAYYLISQIGLVIGFATHLTTDIFGLANELLYSITGFLSILTSVVGKQSMPILMTQTLTFEKLIISGKESAWAILMQDE